MAHRCVARRAMPVVLAGWDQHHVASGDRSLLLVGCHDARTLGDDQNLIARVLVELVARARAEVDDTEVEAHTLRRLHDQLTEHVTSEERADGRLFRQIAGFDDLHYTLPTGG